MGFDFGVLTTLQDLRQSALDITAIHTFLSPQYRDCTYGFPAFSALIIFK